MSGRPTGKSKKGKAYLYGCEKSSMLRYGTRHYAHLKCLADKGRLEEVLRKQRKWVLEQLPYFELKELGVLDLVRELCAKDSSVVKEDGNGQTL